VEGGEIILDKVEIAASDFQNGHRCSSLDEAGDIIMVFIYGTQLITGE
jgi:hypothetical protein